MVTDIRAHHCGLASTLLALLITVIDIKGYRSWSRFFEAFGIKQGDKLYRPATEQVIIW